MSEFKKPNFESPENKPQRYPGTMDIIRINGRWAQIVGSIGPGDMISPIRYLDDLSAESIDFSEYVLDKYHQSQAVKYLVEDNPGILTPKELENIHWASDQDRDPKLKLEVRVFGEYKKN